MDINRNLIGKKYKDRKSGAIFTVIRGYKVVDDCGNVERVFYKTAGKIWLLAYLRDVEKLTEITDEQAEKLDDLDVDSNDKWEDLLEKFNENND